MWKCSCNRGLNNGLNTESSKVSIKGILILGAFLWVDQDQWSEITPIIVDQMNWWILVQSGFISSFDLPSSEWSQITDPDPDHRKGTHPLTLSWIILLFCKDPVVGSLTSLECALDGFHKLSHMAEEVFGEDVFSSGRKKGKQNKNVSGKKMTLFYHNVGLQFTQLSPLRTYHWIVCQTCLFFVPAVPLSSFSNSYFSFPKHCIIEWAKSEALSPTLPWFWVKCLQGYQTATYNFTVGPSFVHQNVTTAKVCLLMFKEVSNLNGSSSSHMIFV